MLLRQLQSHEARMIHEEGPVPRKEPEPRMAVPQVFHRLLIDLEKKRACACVGLLLSLCGRFK